jgi:hypothetical protein
VTAALYLASNNFWVHVLEPILPPASTSAAAAAAAAAAGPLLLWLVLALLV